MTRSQAVQAELLDSYEAERLPETQRFVDEATHAKPMVREAGYPELTLDGLVGLFDQKPLYRWKALK